MGQELSFSVSLNFPISLGFFPVSSASSANLQVWWKLQHPWVPKLLLRDWLCNQSSCGEKNCIVYSLFCIIIINIIIIIIIITITITIIIIIISFVVLLNCF